MFVYNEDSFFAKDIVRWINYVLVFFIIVIPFAASTRESEFNYFFLCVVLGAIIALLITGKAVDETEFFPEKGKKEQDKMKGYILWYSAIAFVLCASMMYYLFVCINLLRSEDFSYILLFPLIPFIILLINSLNIGCLFTSILDDYIML